MTCCIIKMCQHRYWPYPENLHIHLTLKPSVTACRKKSDTEQTKRRKTMKDQHKKKLLRLLWSSVFLHGRTKKENPHTQTSSTWSEHECLLLLCSWCRDPRGASGQWSARWGTQKRQTAGRDARKGASNTFKSNASFGPGYRTRGEDSRFKRRVLIWATLFIFSRMQGFPSEYPKVVSERPEHKLKELLLKRQTFFVFSSVFSWSKYSPGGQISFFSCSESLYPERGGPQTYSH